MAQQVYERIRSNPEFQAMVSRRNTYSFVMTILVMIAYFGFILLVAFNKALLGTPIEVGSIITVGIPLGVGVIVFTIILTWIYVRRANSAFDAEKDRIVAEATK
jgi:uncharacterized membrane protein (DUF485 family)